MKRPGRILIVEDREDWREILIETLVEGGYVVECADTVKGALAKLAQNFYHLLILDIRLEDNDETNEEGMTLLSELGRCGVSAGVEIIMLSAYGTMEQMREAFTQFNVADFASKTKFLDEEFLAQVQRLFAGRMRSNLDLNVYWEETPGPEHLVVNLQVDGHRVKRGTPLQELLGAELDELLCRLFYQANYLMARPLAVGQSGAGILWVQPFYETGGGRPVVVKFGDHRSIGVEHHNFTTYVQPFISGGRSTSVPPEGLRRTVRLGGIVYTLLGTDSDQLDNFGDFYRRSTAGEIGSALDRLFFDTCANWYANPGRLQPLNLTSEYETLLGLTPAKLEHALAHNFTDVQGDQRLHFGSLPGAHHFTNPVRELKEHRFVKSTYVATTHGDFNETNILVDPSGRSWLIDFGRTGQGHVLRDVAELDSIVRFKLLGSEEATLEERLRMEESLASIRHFGEIDKLAASFNTDNAALRKCYDVTLHLRAIAHKIVPPQVADDMGEYYVALLYFALNSIRFHSLTEVQRQHGLLCASLLTDCLRQTARLL
jgi:CheY-like chemotaxis protein